MASTRCSSQRSAAPTSQRSCATFDTVVDAVGGTTFTAAIEHIAPRGLVINVATDRAGEIVSFRAARYDRAPGAMIYTFNLFDELPSMDAAGDLARLVTLLAQQKLVDVVEPEADWQDVSHAIDALLKRTIPLTKRWLARVTRSQPSGCPRVARRIRHAT